MTNRSDDLKVFILGPARSGTSIMYFAMQTVLRLGGPGESHVFPLFQNLIHTYYLHACKFPNPQGTLAGALDTDSFKAHLLDYIRNFYLRMYPTQSWVDKTPGSEALMGAFFIREAFPDAKIIIMQRSGIEFINSYRKKFTSLFNDACTEWASCAKATIILRSNLPEALFVDQFSVANDPFNTGKSVSTFLSSNDYAKPLADFFCQTTTERSSFHDWHHRLGLHDVDWTAEQKDKFETICGPGMTELGYNTWKSA